MSGDWFEEAYQEFLSHDEESLKRLVLARGRKVIEGLPSSELKFLAGEILEKNVVQVIREKREFNPLEGLRVSTAQIVREGFTWNQLEALRRVGERYV